jgi:dTDP-4-amino-4,6-dideoxygalactose transaminase
MIKLFNSTFGNKPFVLAKKKFVSGQIYKGKDVKDLEKKLSSFFNKKKTVVAISDLSNAIFLLLKACNIKKDDEVLVLSFNCLSSTTPIINLGAKPVWIDLEKDYPEMSLSDCEKKVNKKTKALILYHVAGYPTETLKFKIFCKKKNILFIEDINNSFGSEINSHLVGENSDFSILSFYPNRQISSINGAAIVSSNKKITKKLMKLRKYGIEKERFRKKNGEINENFQLQDIGYFFEMSDLCASILSYELKSFKKNINLVSRNVNLYQNKLSNDKIFSKISLYKNSKSNCWVYFIRSKKSNYIINYLKKRNVECTKLHYPNHLYTKMNISNNKNKFQNTLSFWREVIALPCNSSIDKKKILKIINLLNFL